MQSVTIFKLGAIGDVLRTSYLINALNKNFNFYVKWITLQESKSVLEENPYINEIIIYDKNNVYTHTDILICLEDDEEYVAVASQISAKKVIGSFVNHEKNLDYSEDVCEWFDMGKISRFGIDKANFLKKKNKKSFNEMFSKSLSIDIDDIQPKIFFKNKNVSIRKLTSKIKIGFNLFAGSRWPSKELKVKDSVKLINSISDYMHKKNHVFELVLSCDNSSQDKAKVIAEDTDISIVNTDGSLFEFSHHISSCDYLITTDSLGMHLAIANHVNHIVFFNPTSSAEIDSYNLGVKVSSQLDDYCSYKPHAEYDDNLWKNIFEKFIIEIEQVACKHK